jgi:hypothetical protein
VIPYDELTLDLADVFEHGKSLNCSIPSNIPGEVLLITSPLVNLGVMTGFEDKKMPPIYRGGVGENQDHL